MTSVRLSIDARPPAVTLHGKSGGPSLFLCVAGRSDIWSTDGLAPTIERATDTVDMLRR